jgi:parallel beta helix pectate lyase-like protein
VKGKTTMKTTKSLLVSLSIILAAALPAIAVPRVFVSGLGNDANPGSITSPKRSFASALTVTDPGGEIIVLDSAGYGPVTINKSVSIISPTGVYAGITATSGDGVDVSIGSSDTVVLRGLTITGAGGSSGINFTAGGTLHVEECVIGGFSTDGILANGGAGAQLFVKDTICRKNGDGIDIIAGKGSLDHVRIEANTSHGLFVNNARASIANSVASGNTFVGLLGSSSAELSIESCLVANNNTGISASGTAGETTVRVSNSTVTDNPLAGISVSAATLESRSNNTVRGNGTNVSGTITPISGI